MRRHFARPATLGTLLAVAAVLTIIAPFGTGEGMPPGLRALYWAAMVAATYATGFATDTLLRRRLPHGAAQWITPPAIGLAVTVVVLALNLLLLGAAPFGAGWLGDALTILALGVIASAGVQTVWTAVERGQRTGVGAPERPAILDRLPLDKRGALVSLSVEDHYVRVRTMKGEELVLMRLSDAIREAAPEAGLRVHRSHWVATGAVSSARREGDRAVLGMATGGDIPVSRSHIPAVRAAGLLPR